MPIFPLFIPFLSLVKLYFYLTCFHQVPTDSMLLNSSGLFQAHPLFAFEITVLPHFQKQFHTCLPIIHSWISLLSFWHSLSHFCSVSPCFTEYRDNSVDFGLRPSQVFYAISLGIFQLHDFKFHTCDDDAQTYFSSADFFPKLINL